MSECHQSVQGDDIAAASHNDSSQDTSPDDKKLSGFILHAVIFSLCLAQFLSALDTTIVATALPTITSQLHASAAQYTWVGCSYTLASTATTPLWSKFS